MSDSAPEDATLARLNDQISWYDHESRYNQVTFKILKVVTIVVAATISIVSLFLLGQLAARLTAVLGAVVLVCEGVQQLNQYQSTWISYRSTCESLKHEKCLYLALADPYASANDPHRLLAERVESFVSQEHSKWASNQEQSVSHKKMSATGRTR